MSLIGCAPATPIVITIPTTAVVNPTETSTTVPPTETPTPFPTQTPFNPKATIKIVVHVPLTGGGSHEGTEIVRAAELAVYQLAGPINELGYAIDLVSYDDQGDVAVAEANANEIVAEPEILCGVGHYHSTVMVQASEIYHRYELAFISPASTLTTVTDRYYPEVNRVVGRDDGEGMAGAQFANEQGFKKVYVIHTNSSYSKKNADYFMREAYQLGVSVVGVSVTGQTENFEAIIRRILAANPDMIYVASRVNQAGPFFREARAAGYTGAFLSTNIVDRSSLLEIAGSSLVEGGGMYFTEIVAPASNYPDSNQFIEEFSNYYGKSPQVYAAQAYDATGMCLKAIEEASRANDGELPTRQEVASAIRSLGDYDGVTGRITLNNKGDPTPAKYFVFKVVSPDPKNWDQNTIVTTFDVEPPR
jgi:branched-chain amino acid transport system substrate-binding protein